MHSNPKSSAMIITMLGRSSAHNMDTDNMDTDRIMKLANAKRIDCCSMTNSIDKVMGNKRNRPTPQVYSLATQIAKDRPF